MIMTQRLNEIREMSELFINRKVALTDVHALLNVEEFDAFMRFYDELIETQEDDQDGE